MGGVSKKAGQMIMFGPMEPAGPRPCFSKGWEQARYGSLHGPESNLYLIWLGALTQ